MRTNATSTTIPADAIVDLHMHTFASDGRWIPAELAEHLHQREFRVVAVADHDTMYNVPTMRDEVEARGMLFVPAVEMTTAWEHRQVHVLIYGIDPDLERSAPFMTVLRKQQQQLIDSAERAAALLEEHGRRIPSLPEIKGELPLTPHRVFTAMIRHGHGNNLYQAHNIVRGLGEPAKVDLPIKEIVDAAHASGALAIVAHPARDDGWGILQDADLDRMLANVAIDGVEAHYRSYKDADTVRLRAWALANNLLVSSGSDSHWPKHPVDPIAHSARWIAPLLERLGINVEAWEGEAWMPNPPGAESASAPASAAVSTRSAAAPGA
jgi:predicted metal-dependent phosphoesterase TrpH